MAGTKDFNEKEGNMKQMTWWTAILTLSVLLFEPSGIHAADNGVLPFTFSSGTPAKAFEVNEIFIMLIMENLVLIDGAGAELGTFISSQDAEMMYMTKMAILHGCHF